MYSVAKLYEPLLVKEAINILSNNEKAKIIAGGTDVLIKMRQKKIKDMVIVSIKKIKELEKIAINNDGFIEIGSFVTFTKLAENKIINKYLPILKTAALSMGGPQIRNVATIGGNICTGATSADSAPALFALNAKLEIINGNGLRTVDIKDFYLGPSKVDLKYGDMLTKILIPPINDKNWAGHYIKFSVRKAMDISMLGCAVVCSIDDKKEIIDLRIALGTAAPTPIRCSEAENFGLKKTLSLEILEEIGNRAILAANPRSSWRASKEYRQHLIKELTTKNLVEVLKKLEVMTNNDNS